MKLFDWKKRKTKKHNTSEANLYKIIEMKMSIMQDL